MFGPSSQSEQTYQMWPAEQVEIFPLLWQTKSTPALCPYKADRGQAVIFMRSTGGGGGSYSNTL